MEIKNKYRHHLVSMVFKGNREVLKLLAIRIFLLLFLPMSINASTSLSEYPQIKNSWDEGELVSAITQLEDIAKNSVQNNDIAELIKKMTFQKKKLDQWIEKATLLLEQQKFKEAQEMLDFAKSINPNYLPYKRLVEKIKTIENELNYPAVVIFDGKSLGSSWKPYENNGKVATYGKFENSTLLVDVPEGHGWGQVGIEANETVVRFDETNQLLSYHLKFEFDSSNTTAFAIELKGENEDNSHSFSNIVVVYKQIDENLSILELHKDGELHSKLEMHPSILESIELIVQPNNVCYLNLSDGRYLQTTSLKYPIPSKGYNLKIFSQAKIYKASAKMALKSIKLQKLPFEKRLNLSNLDKINGSVILFDGKHLEDIWIPFNEQYKDYFRNYTYFSDNGFIVNIPKDKKRGETGILSLEPAIWLDGLGKDGEIKTTFSFNPNKTTGFSIVMGDINHVWKEPYGKNVNLSWTKIEGKNISKLKLIIENKIVLDENLTGVSPSDIIFTFRNEELSVEGDTFKKKTFKWLHIVSNRALYLFVFSHAYESNLPVKMALKKIVLDRKLDKIIASPKLADGVAPLPIKEIFGTSQRENWECYEWKDKDSGKYCILDKLGCLINIPKNIKSSDGFKSKNNIIILDKRRINEATIKIVMQFNSAKTDNFDINLGNAHLFLEKSNNGMYIFRFGKYLSRSIKEEWLKKEWNGRINIFLSKNSIEVELDGSVVIQIPERPSLSFPLQISTAPRNDYKKEGARFELQKITTQWIAPDGMTATERWNFVDDEDFNPDDFLKELRGEK